MILILIMRLVVYINFVNNFKDNKIKELEYKIERLQNENEFLKSDKLTLF